MANTDFITTDQLLAHWQGHRSLTRRMIEAFPDDEAFTTHSIGGMRPFAELINELLHISVPIAKGVATGEWVGDETGVPATRADALARWDQATGELSTVWATIDPAKFQEVHTAFGQWTGAGHWQILYAIDNEVHHRGQGYVYLRSLGVEPPLFYER